MLSCDGASMTLAWKSPKHCGGSKVNAYYIDKRDADTLVWKEVNLSAVTDRICTVSPRPLGTPRPFRSPEVGDPPPVSCPGGESDRRNLL